MDELGQLLDRYVKQLSPQLLTEQLLQLAEYSCDPKATSTRMASVLQAKELPRSRNWFGIGEVAEAVEHYLAGKVLGETPMGLRGPLDEFAAILWLWWSSQLDEEELLELPLSLALALACQRGHVTDQLVVATLISHIASIRKVAAAGPVYELAAACASAAAITQMLSLASTVIMKDSVLPQWALNSFDVGKGSKALCHELLAASLDHASRDLHLLQKLCGLVRST